VEREWSLKVFGVAFALVMIVGMIAGVGYGVIFGYEFLSVQWGSLSNDWKAILIVVGSLLIVCTLYLSWSVQAAMRRYALAGSGKVQAYNAFADWYIGLKKGEAELSSVESFNGIANQMILWGSGPVTRQTRLLHEALSSEPRDMEQVSTRADGLYLLIRRDIGTNASGDRSFI